ncbi:MAG: DegT/DnrJ/EryC1/StrS family aminotransferase [Bacteroidia bacterium]
MKLNFVDLKRQYETIKPEIDSAIEKVISETAFIGGNYVEQFERDFSDLYGVSNCISVANGTDSLYIIMKMLGIGPGDEVITPANSWISSSETIGQTGAKPVFVDTERDYFTMDIDLVAKAISPRTKAIMPVHLYGQMCDMDALMKLANLHEIPVIEDCAQSHFSEFNGTRAGLFGVAGSFSFYPGKNLGAYGDAGGIITNDDELAEKFRKYARHGALVKHQHEIEGINSRMDGLQAAILSVKCKYIEAWTEKRIWVAEQYNKRLSDIHAITTPKLRPNSRHSYHLYVIRAQERESLAKFLEERGIPTVIHYPTPLPFLEAYASEAYTAKDFPVVHEYASQILSLPIFPEMTESEIDHVADAVRTFYS